MMKKPNWQTKFRDLPEIPKAKIWLKGESYTLEQKIAFKLMNGKTISTSERNVMKVLTGFYAALNDSLKKLDYVSFSDKDFKDFKNYILYAINYITLISNKLTVYQTYRVVINEQVIHSKESIRKKSYLTYPPLHLVQKKRKYNRANTYGSTVFYGSETIDTALNEIRPSVGDLITIGVWKPLQEKEFNSYPISHIPQGFGKNESSTRAMLSFIELRKRQDPTLSDFMEPYLQLLGREFSKPVVHHYEYLISSLSSEEIFKTQKNKNTSFDIECIIYPSVGNKFQTCNLAIRRDIFRHNFVLSKVIEFEVTETHFERDQEKEHDNISLVNYKNYKETDKIYDNDIIW